HPPLGLEQLPLAVVGVLVAEEEVIPQFLGQVARAEGRDALRRDHAEHVPRRDEHPADSVRGGRVLEIQDDATVSHPLVDAPAELREQILDLASAALGGGGVDGPVGRSIDKITPEAHDHLRLELQAAYSNHDEIQFVRAFVPTSAATS